MAITKVTTDGIDMSGNTGGLTWVKGTTAQQPSGALGEIREDTDTKRALVYTDQTGTAEWRYLKEESGTFTLDFLVVAGGGAGGSGTGLAGGGGAGGLRTSFGPATGGGVTPAESTKTITIGQAYDIIVGPGGAASSSAVRGNNGSNSKFDNIESTGGGGGGYSSNGSDQDGKAGGSGGGAGGASIRTGSGGAGTSGEGFAGGAASAGGGSGPYQVGGGGGAAGAGSPSTTYNGSTGAGLGQDVEITGGVVTYATGGLPNQGTPIDGGPNTGKGGSGDGTGGSSGAGGSGVVILRCPRASATLGSGITVNSTTGPGSVNGVAIGGTSDYYYSATAGSGTITFN